MLNFLILQLNYLCAFSRLSTNAHFKIFYFSPLLDTSNQTQIDEQPIWKLIIILFTETKNKVMARFFNMIKNGWNVIPWRIWKKNGDEI